MGDRLRRPVNALAASAKILNATREDAPKPENWHDEAWGFRNTTGELRFAEMWLANSLSRCRLVAARRPEPGADPEPIDDGPAAELVARLAGGVGGQSALLRAFATHLLTPGVGYLIGEPGVQGAIRWGVYSADQIRLSQRTEGDGQRVYELREGENPATDWRVLPPDALPVKVFRPHPRYSWQPDSPVRGALPILRELALLTQHVEASATSRLAGAGILAMDSAIEFPPGPDGKDGWDTWVQEFLDSVNKPITDRGSAAAYTPFPLRIPGPNIKEKILHLMFNTPFDEHSLKLRDEAIGRLATAMDMPKRALTGEQENHWGKWATTEEGITLHVEPNMELICDGLTKGYLQPGLAAGAARQRGDVVTTQDERRVLVLREPEPVDDDGELIVWFDATNLAVRPDRSDDTIAAYDRWEAGGDELRKELGVTDAGPPEGGELERRVWLQMIQGNDPELQRLALRKLGLVEDDELPPRIAAPPPAGPPPPGPAPEPVDEDDRALPDTREAPPPSDEAPARPAAAIAPAAALVAACDGLVHRALERVGNKLRSANRANLNGAADCPPPAMHTCLNASARGRSLDQLLAGAWERVPEVAANLGEDAEALTAVLDHYTRTLIRTRTAHTWEQLACALGCDCELGLDEKVPA